LQLGDLRHRGGGDLVAQGAEHLGQGVLDLRPGHVLEGDAAQVQREAVDHILGAIDAELGGGVQHGGAQAADDGFLCRR
jgi:hypothetical protein